MTNRLKGLGILVVVAFILSGCAASKAFKQGETAARAGNLDEAVAYYRAAVQADPENTGLG